MAPKARSPINFFIKATAYCCLLAAVCSCENLINKTADTIKNYSIDTTGIPPDTISASDKKLSNINGLYYNGSIKYSGIILLLYPGGRAKAYSSIFEGMLHGTYRSYYENGQPFEVRHYKNNLSTGRHYGYWLETGKLKFEYTYYEEKREGLQKKWYKNGQPFVFTNYKNDREDGLQKAWRENGKLYINYVAKDGYTYGLQQTALCFTLINQKMK